MARIQMNLRVSDEASKLLDALCSQEVRDKGDEIEYLIRKEAREKGIEFHVMTGIMKFDPAGNGQSVPCE